MQTVEEFEPSPEDHVRCRGDCERSFLRKEFVKSSGFCGACYISNQDGSVQLLLTFLEGKPFVMRSHWTQWAMTRHRIQAGAMARLFEHWLKIGLIESKVVKHKRGAPGTLYRLKDMELRVPNKTLLATSDGSDLVDEYIARAEKAALDKYVNDD
jgi:hypothetical protein